MQFAMLADHPKTIPLIASWYFGEWGHLGRFASQEEIEHQLQSALNKKELPLVVLAFENDELAGVAELKYHEMDIYPEKDHWIGGIYVPAQHRGKGVAAHIIRRAVDIARSLGVKVLNLQTEHLDGGLYAKLGWVPLDQVTYKGVDVLVMENHLVNR